MKSWKEHTKIISLNGQFHSKSQLLAFDIQQLPDWEAKHYLFIKQWISKSNFIEVSTSGSTGNPKQIKIHKSTFIQSALNTGKFLNLKSGDRSLLCLPGDYIAGKMMIVRAFVLGLDLYWEKPSSTPKLNQNYIFSAMTPMQLQNILKFDKSKLNYINKLIIGGAPVNDFILNSIINSPTKIFETYGMTETASHIALKSINGKDKSEYFTVLNEIKIDLDKRGCLTIGSPTLLIEKLITNDIVEVKNEKQFKWLGRSDYVINSGGIKLFPEQIEKKLNPHINSDFFIFGIKDDHLTNILGIALESTEKIDITIFSKVLDKYEIPKKAFYFDKFLRTNSGKVKRKETLGL